MALIAGLFALGAYHGRDLSYGEGFVAFIQGPLPPNHAIRVRHPQSPELMS